MLWLIFISCAVLTGYRGEPVDPTDNSEVVVEVPKGASARNLGPTSLTPASSMIQSFGWYVRFHKEGGCIKAGRHAVSALHELRRDDL